MGETGHDIKYHWETAEHVMVTNMGRGNKAHCTYRNYRRHPGSGNAKGKKSNGKISRISFHHIEDGGCSGE